MRTEGDRSASLTPGKPHNFLNQTSGLSVNRILFFSESIAISHAEMGETTSRPLRSSASGNSVSAGSRSGSPFISQIAAHVSRRYSVISDYCCAFHFSPVGKVRSTPGAIVTVPSSAPNIRENGLAPSSFPILLLLRAGSSLTGAFLNTSLHFAISTSAVLYPARSHESALTWFEGLFDHQGRY